MQTASKSAQTEGLPEPLPVLHFVIEPEPWLRIFLRNIADLFRSAPPKPWVTARPAAYWADALVDRPVAWRAVRQSFLFHTLVIVAVYALNLAWLNQPQVLPEMPRTQAKLHYELSEYLPPVNLARPDAPKRVHPQKADPEFAPQEIVVTNANHISTRQMVAQPSPVILKHDVPMPNLIVSTPIPGAPMAMNHPLQVLPMNAPQVASPSQAVVQSSLRPLVFLPARQPVVAAPASPIADRRRMQALPMEGPVVASPAPEIAAHRSLEIPVQAPPQVAAPAANISASHALPSLPPVSAPQVAPPTTAAASRNLGNLGLPLPGVAAAPPVQPVSSNNNTREKEIGQLLVLNAQPVAPSGPLAVPEGNRPGEFAASPAGHAGATARPEIKQGNSAPASDIYVAAPPMKITAGPIAATAPPNLPRSLSPDKTDRPRDSIDTKIFGTRRNYSMKLSMPNLTSAMGSWSMRFAELNSTRAPHGESDLSAPEAIRKVDPAYPQDLMHDRVEGTVVLYAIIHSDGSVGDVRVLEGFDDRLNQNAVKALQQWRFHPGTKDGEPVDVEAVVRVPFKVKRPEF